MGLDKWKKENDKERLEWINFWTDFMKRNPNKVWSRQQADFINSVMRGSHMSPEDFLKMKSFRKR